MPVVKCWGIRLGATASHQVRRLVPAQPLAVLVISGCGPPNATKCSALLEAARAGDAADIVRLVAKLLAAGWRVDSRMAEGRPSGPYKRKGAGGAPRSGLPTTAPGARAPYSGADRTTAQEGENEDANAGGCVAIDGHGKSGEHK